MLDRRSFIAASLGGSTILALGLPASAAVGGSVKVDVSRLRAQGLGPNATRIQEALERELAGVAAPGTSLVVTVRGISMPSYTGHEGMFGGGGSLDGIDSEATVIGPGGRVVATYPVQSSSSASAAGPWYTQGIDQLRLDAMAKTNASWIRRYVRG
jgi:hypothetical protein